MEQAKLSAFSRQHFDQEPLMVRAAGRINLIGEHTDYNNGFVLPAAIDKYIYTSISRNNTDKICLYSKNFDERFEANLTDIKPVKGWPNYILGVIDQLQQQKKIDSGFNIVVTGNVPTGAGISSSAALECAIVLSLDQLFELHLSRKEMAFIAQAAEHSFPQVHCGIMDMWASLHGQPGQVMKLDCRSLEYELVPYNFQDTAILLFDSGVKHSLAASEYNQRRLQCEQGVAWVRQKYPEVNSLRDVTFDQLEEMVRTRDVQVWERCSYVLEENARLQKACEYLRNGDLAAFGMEIYASHEGLKHKYNVSCPELDLLVDSAQSASVPGARMMGGGFGGCTINILPAEDVNCVIDAVSVSFLAKYNRIPETYVLQISGGAGRI